MEVKKIDIKPMGFSFEPEFHITIDYMYNCYDGIPLKFNGYLFLNRFRFAFLHEFELNNQSQNDLLVINNKNSSTFKNDQKVFVAPFSRFVLNKLEDSRNDNPKRDLIFRMNIETTFVLPQFIGIKLPVDSKEILNENSVFKIYSKTIINEDYKISSGDWLHDFCPVFSNSNYQVFEVIVPNSLNNDKEINKKINAAIQSLGEMQKAKLNGDWNEVIKLSRPIWELLGHKEEIISLLSKENYNTQSIDAFENLIKSLFDFSSKFIHKESKGKQLMEFNNACKEDAEMVYLIGVSLVNLISKKLAK